MTQINQINLLRQIADNYEPCGWGCGYNINDNATELYLKKHRTRCVACELEYLEVVFGLTQKQRIKLFDKWVK